MPESPWCGESAHGELPRAVQSEPWSYAIPTRDSLTKQSEHRIRLLARGTTSNAACSDRAYRHSLQAVLPTVNPTRCSSILHHLLFCPDVVPSWRRLAAVGAIRSKDEMRMSGFRRLKGRSDSCCLGWRGGPETSSVCQVPDGEVSVRLPLARRSGSAHDCELHPLLGGLPSRRRNSRPFTLQHRRRTLTKRLVGRSTYREEDEITLAMAAHGHPAQSRMLVSGTVHPNAHLG